MLADAVPLLLGPLFLVSGLIPSVMFANKQAADSLMDAMSSAPPPLTDSPPLRSAPLLFYPEAPRVADVLAVMARLDAAGLKKPSGSVPSVVWDNSKSSVAGGDVWKPDRPAARTLLRRTEFASRVAALPARRVWPADEDGPAGGVALRDALGASSLRSRPLNAVALDAVWVALSGGSSYLSPEELDRQLTRWRPAADEVSKHHHPPRAMHVRVCQYLHISVHVLLTHHAHTVHIPCTYQVRLEQFERALLQGRATIVGGYLILFGLQAPQTCCRL